MKKLLVLAVFSVFTLSSFNSSEKAKVVEKKTTKLQKYNFWCANANYGSFWHDGDLESAKKITAALCSI